MRRRQSGVALLTVLLLVAVMSVLVTAMLDDIRFGVRRAANAQATAQAQWYALGTETLALARIGALAARGDAPPLPHDDWIGKPFAFPIEHGTLRASIHDATGCFNLNSVVEGAPGQWQRREPGAAQFGALLVALELPAGQAASLVDALVDWIDSDQTRGGAGAEDLDYAAYRTSGELLAEVSELRAIAGFDDATYRKLRPHVCALPEATLSPINLNTLRPDDAALVAMLAGGSIDLPGARRLLQSRPLAGWQHTAEFWNHPLLRDTAIPAPVREQVSLRTRYYELRTRVEHAGAQVVLNALLEHPPMEGARLVARRWSEPE